MTTGILFVCTGNTCRSPMAVGVMPNDIEQSGNIDEFIYEPLIL